MIHSMTAFARESTSTPQGVLTLELRSVNHRYLDCSFKLPDMLRALEPQLRDTFSAALARGKVECHFRLQAETGDSGQMAINESRLQALLTAADLVRKHSGEAVPVDPLRALQFPGVYGSPQVSEETLQQQAHVLFASALDSLKSARQREGEKLAGLIQDRLDQVESHVAATRDILPDLRQRQHDKILSRLAELNADIDQDRLEQELVYLAQKADVDEELDRLEAHVQEVRRTLEKGGPCGRRLDFLMQELNREANTLSSKSQSATTTLSAVELKVLIEQMREQIQNIE